MDLSQNYFSLFDLPQRFIVDEQQLVDKFRQLQKEVHPDRHVGGCKQQQLLAVRLSSHVNMAYQTLKSPLLRAQYLLELAQMPLNTQTMTIADGDFLFQQMQWRDELSTVTESKCEQTLTELLQTVANCRAELLSAFAHAYDEKDFCMAKQTVAKLHFVEKMMVEVEQVKFSITTDEKALRQNTA